MNTHSLGQQIFADLSAGNLEAVLQRCADDVRFTAVRAEPCAAVPVLASIAARTACASFSRISAKRWNLASFAWTARPQVRMW